MVVYRGSGRVQVPKMSMLSGDGEDGLSDFLEVAVQSLGKCLAWPKGLSGQTELVVVTTLTRLWGKEARSGVRTPTRGDSHILGTDSPLVTGHCGSSHLHVQPGLTVNFTFVSMLVSGTFNRNVQSHHEAALVVCPVFGMWIWVKRYSILKQPAWAFEQLIFHSSQSWVQKLH